MVPKLGRKRNVVVIAPVRKPPQSLGSQPGGCGQHAHPPQPPPHMISSSIGDAFGVFAQPPPFSMPRQRHSSTFGQPTPQAIGLPSSQPVHLCGGAPAPASWGASVAHGASPFTSVGCSGSLHAFNAPPQYQHQPLFGHASHTGAPSVSSPASAACATPYVSSSAGAACAMPFNAGSPSQHLPERRERSRTCSASPPSVLVASQQWQQLRV